MKIDFTKVMTKLSFEGNEMECNVAKPVGNAMMYNGSVLLDIGFEELAKEIYYSDGEVEVPEKYVKALTQVIYEAPMIIAAVKRELLNKLK